MKVYLRRKWLKKNVSVFVFLTKRDSKAGEERRAWRNVLVLLLWIRHCTLPAKLRSKSVPLHNRMDWHSGMDSRTHKHLQNHQPEHISFLQNTHNKNILVLFDAIKWCALLQLTNAHDRRVTASWMISYYSCQRSETVLFKCWFTGKDDCTSSITHTLAVREKHS